MQLANIPLFVATVLTLVSCADPKLKGKLIRLQTYLFSGTTSELISGENTQSFKYQAKLLVKSPSFVSIQISAASNGLSITKSEDAAILQFRKGCTGSLKLHRIFSDQSPPKRLMNTSLALNQNSKTLNASTDLKHDDIIAILIPKRAYTDNDPEHKCTLDNITKTFREYESFEPGIRLDLAVKLYCSDESVATAIIQYDS